MDTTLTAGVRRLSSADEMALMYNLIAQAKDDLASSNTQDNAHAPFPTLSLGGSLSIAPDYATLTNGNLNSANGRSTRGSVNIANEAATPNEISTSQTCLSQVFMLGANDCYLSFTLAGTATNLRNGTGINAVA